MIKINNVSKTYIDKSNKVEALKSVSLSLPNKGFIGLSGENGCGKSTLLNLISTVDLEFEGSILIDNLDVKKDFEYIRKKVISYVFQEDFFISNLTVKENIEFNNGKGIIDDDSNIVPLEKFDSNTNELSGGQKQKVSILRALQKQYDILLVDEPTSSLDEKSTKLVFEVLSKIAKEKLVILVSHDKEMMNAYCNLIVYLNNGQLEDIKNNNTVSDVTYTDSGVIFNGDINLIAIDKGKIEEIISSTGKFVIEKETKINNKELDYSINNHDTSINNDCSKFHRKIIQKSFNKANKSNATISIILLSIFIFLLQMFLDFATFNGFEFMYKTINENQDSYVICKQFDPLPSYIDLFEKEKLDQVAKQYGTSVDYNIEIHTGACYEFNNFEYYVNTIDYVVYTNFSNYDFICGKKPTDNSKIAITDYVADALIKRNDSYSGYDDIINKGICLNEEKYYISGIIDSGYKKYEYNNLSDKESVDFDYYQQHFFSSIFYLNEIKGNEYAAFHISSEDIFATIIITDKVDNIKVNQKFADSIGYLGNQQIDLFKSDYGYIEIDGIKSDDLNSDKNIIYLPQGKIDILDFEFSAGLDYFMTNVSNKDFFLYLNNHFTEFLCYSYSYANKTINIVYAIKYIFVAILSIFILIILLVVHLHIKKSLKLNNNLYCLSRLNGDDLKTYALIEIKEIAFVILCTIGLNFILYYGGYYLINYVLTQLLKIDIVIFMNHFKCLLLSCLLLIIVFILITFISNSKRNKENLLKMIK